MTVFSDRLRPLAAMLARLRHSLRTLFGEESVRYIGGSQTLPPPLDKAREEALLSALATADDRAAKAIRDTLVEHNLRLVVFIAKRFENTGAGMEDLISIGTLGLIKAVDTFKADKNIKLATYASRCIENEILMYVRKTARMRSDVSLEEPLNVDWDGNELLVADVLGTDGDVVDRNLENEEERSLVREAVEQLPARERTIIAMRFGLDDPLGREKTQKEVADKLGISQSYISRLEKRIIAALRKEIIRFYR